MGETSTDSTIELKQLRQEIEKLQKKQEEDKSQNELMKEVLEELRFTRNEIVEMKKKQKEDSDKMANLNTTMSQILGTLESPKIIELCGRWITTYSRGVTLSDMDHNWLLSMQRFSENGNNLTWKTVTCLDEATVRVRSDECKIRKDGKIEFNMYKRGIRFVLDVSDDILTICNGEKIVKYKRWHKPP